MLRTASALEAATQGGPMRINDCEENHHAFRSLGRASWTESAQGGRVWLNNEAVELGERME